MSVTLPPPPPPTQPNPTTSLHLQWWDGNWTDHDDPKHYATSFMHMIPANEENVAAQLVWNNVKVLPNLACTPTLI